ncbi:MAG TPA: hypothetical protein PL042_04040, partial [Caldisericia bacterium]|nr:hypothetical protein [Caldisericia bacterium]
SNDAASWRALFDNNGNNSTVLPLGAGDWNESYYNTRFESICIATSDGKFMVFETPIAFWTNARTFGQLDGVMNIGRSPCPLGNGDIVYVDTIPWIFLAAAGLNYDGKCLVRLT